ncbi:MAG TPA: bifunctional diguanylate cyclase/phosphodiesterase [Nitrosomonas sp.]|nr:bifunctional diguanylate cyclase/phosphodiesterase [Nitrosomonas sp.]MBP6354399.1 bifunctional diguanylate cyclase/phosphodiesterase [Nitrosomonas sp.]MBP9869987.1 bifunctional diguanylate cyclase/phosphodiesterase [Nitrosomonas sp.]HQV89116.1 bifunctional diguanylate cyclase/phosphodiesterase [Nitrosomonas sp.]HRB97526.1 bifunctional diguanylate cyclase/phosphodiesterase [Nitrosomonas sp.]
MNSKASFDLLSGLSDFAVGINAYGIIQQASESSQKFLQLTTGLVHESIELIIQSEDIDLFKEAQEKAKNSREKQRFVLRLLRQKVLPVWVDCHILPLQEDGYLVAAFDANHWKDNENRLVYLSTHDPLTGLPGRVLLNDRISMNIHTAERERYPVSLIVLNLDGFKRINDLLGHNIGDELIKAVAERLQNCVRRSDTIARISDDEFSLIMIRLGQDNIEMIAKKILTAMQQPFRVNEHTLHITASLGVSIYPEHGKNSSLLYKNAEMAMYRAKSLGKNHWKIYSDQINDIERTDLSLQSAMYGGIEKGEFSLHYQPIFCAQTGRLRGAEALMRWHNPNHGFISPMRFIPLAESNGLIKILGAWALSSACHQARQWQKAGLKDFYISVNVSPRQFVQEDFLEMINRVLDESGLLPENLMLEITEGVLMDNPQRSKAILAQLHEMGVKIAIDDFGTGYSSLAYLKKFSLSVLKIDKSFVDDMINSAEDMAIVGAILRLAEGLNLLVVAEGVENDAQLGFLRQRGCNLVQGYLTGRPVNSEDFKEKHMA